MKGNVPVTCINKISQIREDHREFRRGKNVQSLVNKQWQPTKSTTDECKPMHIGRKKEHLKYWMSYVQGKRLARQCQDEGKHLLSEQLGSKKANETLQCTRQGIGEQSEQCNPSVDQCFALLWVLCVVPGSSALEEYCKINRVWGRAAKAQEKAQRHSDLGNSRAVHFRKETRKKDIVETKFPAWHKMNKAPLNEDKRWLIPKQL